MQPLLRCLPSTASPITATRGNCWRASIGKIARAPNTYMPLGTPLGPESCALLRYQRLYPTTMVLPDGATIRFRYKEPREIVKVPFPLSHPFRPLHLSAL